MNELIQYRTVSAKNLVLQPSITPFYLHHLSKYSEDQAKPVHS